MATPGAGCGVWGVVTALACHTKETLNCQSTPAAHTSEVREDLGAGEGGFSAV